MANKTPKPSGCVISRNGNVFKLTWKINAKNSSDGQKARYRYKYGNKTTKWKTASIGKKATSKSYKVSKAGLKWVQIQVQNDQKKESGAKNLSASDWAGATFKLAVPPTPTAGMALDSNFWNRCNVSWSHNGNSFGKTDKYWFDYCKIETTFHDEKNSDKWKRYSNSSGKNKFAQSGSLSQQEESLKLSKDIGWVRKFRFSFKGKMGWSATKTVSHYYSIPKTPTIREAKISKNDVGGMDAYIQWNSPSNTFHPIDYTLVQYGIAVPSINMSCPPDISWTDRPTMLDTTGTKDDADHFSIDSILGLDNCMFARIVNAHDNNRSYSVPKIATGIITSLSAPESLNIDPDYETYRISVTAENVSPVPDSNMAVVYRSISEGVSSEQIIGIIPHGVSSITVQCPNWDTVDDFNFGVFAFVGNVGTYIKTADEYVDQNKKYYTRSGTGERPISIISEPTGNPKENNYYELINDEYFLTEDTEVVEDKVYYNVGDLDPFVYTYVETPVYSDLNLYYELSAIIERDVSYISEGVERIYTVYEIPEILMQSDVQWRGGDIPRPPSDVDAVTTDYEVACVTWNWAWKSADIAELSWSNHKDAWESTDQPETYRISNTHTGKWYIYGLSAGETWYIRVRLLKTTADGENPGPWSPIREVDMASAPNAPILTVSKPSVTHDGTFTVSWDYVSTDGTEQKDAKLVPVEISQTGEITYGDIPIRSGIGTSRSIDIIPDDIDGWETGNKYGFALQVISESDKQSEWSNIEYIAVAEPLECSITGSSFVQKSIYSHTEDSAVEENKKYYSVTGTEVVNPVKEELGVYYELEDGIYGITTDSDVDETKTYFTLEGVQIQTPDPDYLSEYYELNTTNILTAMPITVSTDISGGLDSNYYAGVSIERLSPYMVDRPDESTYSGYEGETIFSDSQVDDPSSITIPFEDLVGTLDDTALYRLTVLAYDDLDQFASDYIDFEVRWDHQAAIPTATVEFDPEYSVIKITPAIDPAKYEEGDTFDIYRLSVDKPVLIVKGGTFGQTYVDPYPTIGEFGGHRVVTVTANGDYIANDEESDMAWVDLDKEDGDYFETDFPIINYGAGSFEILYNVDLSTNWSKDFKETKYLGGHIQGDWKAGVSRTSSISSVTVTEQNSDTIESFRRLAEYTGMCHVRTLEGSNYYADVQVSESYTHNDPLTSYSFSITRVDNDSLDGIELSEWNKLINNI